MSEDTDQSISQNESDNEAFVGTLAERAAASADRVAHTRRVMEKRGADALVVRNTSDIAWLTAFDNVFDSEQAHCLLITRTKAILHTDSRYVDACNRAAEGTDIAVDSKKTSHAKWVFGELKGERAIAIDRSISLGEYRALEDARGASSVRIIETSGLVVGLRGVKDELEIKRLKAAQAITDAAFTHICGFMHEGMTEREVQIELEDYMRRHGASDLAFASIVAAGSNAAAPHSIPGETKLEAGQCVVMDFGAKAYGYCSDMTRTIFIGEPSAELKGAYDVLRQANERVEAMLAPGVSGADAHNKAEEILAEGGYAGAMGHALGHGVGIDIHEQPVLAPRNTTALVPGNVVTVEPGIYIPGNFGMRLEDFGVITQDGFDVFTGSTHEMVII